MTDRLTGPAKNGGQPGEPGFMSLYTPIRQLFCDDPMLLEGLQGCTEYSDKVEFLLSLKDVETTLSNLRSVRENPGEDLPHSNAPKLRIATREAPPLAYGSNKKYPHLSKAVEVKSCESEGRYLSARQKINPGDVLIVDKPYTTSLFSTHYSTHCVHCTARLAGEFVTCTNCSKVKFCSQECFKDGMRKSHRWECGVLELIDNDDIGKMAAIAFRTISSTGYEYFESMAKVLDPANTSYTAGDSQDSTKPTYKEGNYLSVYHQIDNKGKRPTGDHLKRTFTALILTRYLQLTNWFPEHLRESVCSPTFKFISAIMLKHIQACACNAYEINEFVKTGESMINSASLELAGAVYPSISLSNHSCAGNTSRTSYGTTCVVRAIQTINPNEKVYDNYGQFYHTEEKESRQQRLNAQYFFACRCPACTHNWPLYKDFGGLVSVYHCPGCQFKIGSSLHKMKCGKCKRDLKGVEKLINHLKKLQTDFRRIMDGINEENAGDYIKTYSTLLAQIEKIFKPPCREITECQQVLLQSFAVLGNHSVIKPSPQESQLVLYNQGSSDEDEDEDEDDDEIPGLI